MTFSSLANHQVNRPYASSMSYLVDSDVPSYFLLPSLGHWSSHPFHYSYPDLLLFLRSPLISTDDLADVAANLKGKVPKPMAQKIMLTLAGKSAEMVQQVSS